MAIMDDHDEFGRKLEIHEEAPFEKKDTISQIAATARDLGLSYGQLQARRYEQEQRLCEIERRRVQAEKELRKMAADGYVPCEFCGEPYRKKDNMQRFCCISCASKYNYRKRKKGAQK